jgi:hypothetical protein
MAGPGVGDARIRVGGSTPARDHLGTVDHLGADRKVVHGPWSAEECQAVLILWHVTGWIELVADFEPPWSLTPADWQGRASRDGAGKAHEYPEWLGLAQKGRARG